MTDETIENTDCRLRYPSELVMELCAFFNRFPEYETNIVDIMTLSHIVHTELRKFVSRPHEKIIKTKTVYDSGTRQ